MALLKEHRTGLFLVGDCLLDEKRRNRLHVHFVNTGSLRFGPLHCLFVSSCLAVNLPMQQSLKLEILRVSSRADL